ncbi:MAG: ATP-binding protein [Thomasclavelia sp.]|nr:ATP-binding protein [Thomasclavelia sp.]
MFKRTINKIIEKSIANYPVTIITGPRQVGKSTEVYKFVKSHKFNYVSLDDISERNNALSDPVFFIQQHEYPLIIDEIQYAPILMEVIETIVNKKRLEEGCANGLFILTGSQTFSLMKNVTQSLAGRAHIISMLPMSYNETISKIDTPFLPSSELFKKKINPLKVQDLYKTIIRGFYPELYNNPNLSASEYYENYVKTYLDRDVSELINIKDKLAFHNFLQYLASITSSQLNYSNISKAIGVDIKTIKSWISILETSGIIYLLQPYSEIKLSKRIVKSPKVYFVDTGLAAFLARVYDSNNLMISNLAGPFMETYVVNEIRKSYLNNNLPFNAYYYRDNNQNEIDLVLQINLTNYCIEIKKGTLFKEKDVKAFKQLDKSDYQIGPSCIICNTEKNYYLNKNTMVLSLSTI